MVKIFGLEINKANKNSASVVTPPTTINVTKPSIPLKKSYPRSELGDSGTLKSHGIITEDYNANLQGATAMRVYDEMRKGDGTVRAAMLVTTLPIRRAKWFINPISQEAKDIEIAEFVKKALFEFLSTSWEDVVREALLMLPYGVMVFEKVYGIKEWDGKTYVIVDKLAPRLPKSIQRWELSDGTFGIQQIKQMGGMAEIPGSKLLIFVNEKEGDNWWGTSMLRAAYKHWYYKNNFYKIDAIAFERQGLGVPMIKMPNGYTVTDEQKAATAAANIRASESAYLLLPPGYEAEFMNMGSSTTRDPEKSINHHNKEILQSVLAQFLELGQTSTGGGSRALSEDHSDLFLKAMEAVAGTIQTEVNKNLIPELVNMNFDDVTVYPKIDFNGIIRTDVKALAEAFGALVNAKGITPTMKDEIYLRALIGLPEVDEEEINEELDGVDVDNPEPEKGPDKEDGDEEDIEETPEDKKEEKKEVDKATMSHTHTRALRKYDDGKGFMTWRKLTFTEQKVSFKNIEDKMNSLQKKFEEESIDLLNTAKDSFVSKLQTALEDDDMKAVAETEIKFVNDYKKLLKEFMKQGYEYGKNNVSTEMGVPVPPNSSDTLARMGMLADTLAWKAAIDLETKAKISVHNGVKKLSEPNQKFKSVIQVVGMIDSALESTIDKFVQYASGLIVNQSINMGRKDVFDRNADKIHGLQRSEILDADTCDFCLSMDGRIVSLNDEWASEDEFHNNCRGIWVEILNEEPELPEIEGIPDNLGDYYGGEPNALVQPPKPIIKPDSPAKDEVDRREEEKKKKKKKKEEK